MKKIALLLGLLIGGFQLASAQSVVTGTVTDTHGGPIPGARVSTPDGATTVLTELDGTFRLETDSRPRYLAIDYVGMASKRVRPSNSPLNIKLSKGNWSRHYQGEFSIVYSLVNDKPYNTLGVETVHGARLNKYIFLGAGAGLQYTFSVDQTTIPVFGNAKFFLPVNDNLEPFISGSAGYAFGLNSGEGFYGNVGLGFKYDGIQIGLGWQFQDAGLLYDEKLQSEVQTKLDGFYVRLGFLF